MSISKAYKEGRSDVPTVPANFPLVVQPPLTQSGGLRKDRSGLRTASPGRLQFVALLADNSNSVFINGKWRYITEAAQEVVARMKLKGGRLSAFLVSLLIFGTDTITEEEFTLKPCMDIDEDRIKVRGNGGGTEMCKAVRVAEQQLKVFDEQYLQKHEDPDRVPPPLIIILTDGYSGDGDPTKICQRIASTNTGIGIPPIIITVGVEFGGGEPNVPMLQAMSTKTSDGRPLYFDISEAAMLAEFLAVLSSSSASTADEVMDQAEDVKYGWNDYPEDN